MPAGTYHHSHCHFYIKSESKSCAQTPPHHPGNMERKEKALETERARKKDSVCKSQRKTKREKYSVCVRESETKRDKARQSETKRDKESVCMCVYVTV